MNRPSWIQKRLGLCLVLTITTALHAQWTHELGQRGFTPGLPFDFSGLDSVNMVNGAVNLAIPITALPEGPGGSGIGVTLHYSSALWDTQFLYATFHSTGTGATQYVKQSHVFVNPSSGWTYGYNYGITEEILPDPASGVGPTGACFDNMFQAYEPDALYPYRYRAVFPDGSLHVLYPANGLGGAWDAFPNPGDNDGWNAWDLTDSLSTCGQAYSALQAPPRIGGMLVYYTADGTRMRVEVGLPDGTHGGNPPWTMYFPDGKKVFGHAEQTDSISDRNNNLITITNVGLEMCPDGITSCYVTEIADAFNRKIRKLDAGYAVGVWFRQVGFGGNLQWKVTWSENIGTVSLGYHTQFAPPPSWTPSSGGIPCAVGWTDPTFCGKQLNPIGITSVQLEATADSGAVTYGFDYSPTPPFSPQGQLTTVTLPYLATMQYQWAGFGTQPEDANTNPISQKTVTYSDPQTGQADQWTYTIPYSSQNLPASWVTNPDGGTVTSYFSTYVSTPYAPMRGLLVRTDQPDESRVEKIWDFQQVNFIPGANPFAKTEVRSVGNGGTAPVKAAVKNFTYDLNGNVKSVTEYPWLAYSLTNLPHNSAGALAAVNNLGTSERTTTNIYQVCIASPCLPGASVNTANEYWQHGAVQLLNALGSTTVTASDGSTAAFSTFDYDNPQTTGNLQWERHWDNTQAGTPPATLSAGNSIGIFRTYTTDGNLLTEIDPNGNTTTYAYDDTLHHPYPVSATQTGSGGPLTWNFGWDALTGLRTSETDPNGVQTTADYDTRGRVRHVKQGNNARQTETIYDDSTQPPKITVKSDLNSFGDGLIQSVRYFDTLGQNYGTVQTDDNGALGIETDSFRMPSASLGFSYQLASNPYRTLSDATMGWTRTKLDQNGRVSEVEYFSGSDKPAPWGTNTASTGVKQTVYAGEVTQARDEASKWTYRESDALGRLVKVTEDPLAGGLGYITTYAYDALDNLHQVNQGAQTRTFNYTSLERLMNAFNPESQTISYTYDNNGNLLTRTDARNLVTTMAYDGLNRVTTKSYNDGGITPNVAYCYDGQTWNGTQCSGSPAAPFKGRLTEEASSVSSTRFTNYDGLGRVTASRQTTGGAPPYDFGYHYLPNNLDQITYPSGRQVSYTYTGAGRIATVSGTQSGNSKNYTDPGTPITYSAHGSLDTLKFSSSSPLIEQHCYNPRLQATGIRVGSSATSNCTNSSDLLNIGLTFGTTQNNGNLQSQTIIRGSQTWTQTYTNCYDGVNRLTCGSESGSGTWSQAYGYDAFGNRWVSSSSSTLPPLTFQVPTGSNWFVNNQILTSPSGNWTYDYAGNLLGMAGMPDWHFYYDAENRQIKADTAPSNPTSTYKYDGEGRRVSKTWSGQTTTFVYDAFGQLAAEYGGPNSDTGTQYLTSDHLGSTRLVTDSNGAAVKCYDYLPFGEEIGSGTAARTAPCFGSGSYPVAGGATNREFTSKERDAETGLDWFETRYFSSAQGRFTSPDAPFAGQHVEDPQSWNMYGYVRNNPLRYTDPDGRDCFQGVSSCANYLIGGAGAVVNAFSSGIINAPNRIIDAAISPFSSFRFGDAVPDAFTPSNVDQQQGAEAANAMMLISPLAEVGAARAVSATAAEIPQITQNAARGAASESRVLGDMGLTKNTTPIKGTAGKSIPDINTSAMVGDVKDVKVVSNTPQMKIQREVAGQTGRDHVIVTGTNTHVTKPTQQPPTRIIRRDDLGPQQ